MRRKRADKWQTWLTAPAEPGPPGPRHTLSPNTLVWPPTRAQVKQFQALERRRTAPERETMARLRVFARYESSPGEHDELVDGILLEHRLRARVQVKGAVHVFVSRGPGGGVAG
eukprot:193881-Chlamydomonas_euryale.AAC.2